ncbi:MAG: transporter substrate-binding domain-containing protein [Bacteroidetes bacterium]|nr:transporter substrate-binding domain-containing protein [Bacteroidota bacterium]
MKITFNEYIGTLVLNSEIFSTFATKKKLMRQIIFIVLLTVSIAPLWVFAQYEVMFSDNYPPYNYSDENGKLVGFNIDILVAINDLYGSNITIVGDNWDIINEALDKGDIQAIGGANYPGSPDNNYIYSRSAISTSHCFLYNTQQLSKFSLEVLRSTEKPIVAMWQNDVLIHYVLSINPSAQLLFVDNYEQLINTLDREDVTCIFAQRVGSMYYAEKLGKENIQPLEHRILERNMGFKVSNDSPELAEIINNGLEVILANGEYQRIYDKWINEYNKDPNDWHNYLKYIIITGILIAGLIILLLIANWILQTKVRTKTKDLQQQLELNSHIMTELEKQKIIAEESDKMKSAFLANMSHEIRTPMNGILGFADLLKSADYSSEKQAEFIGIIQQSGNRMLGTINNIIDVSKLESGLEKIQITEVNIKSIITELLNFFKPEASLKGLTLTLNENNRASSKSFYTDEYKLNSILTNLIKNALKFTKEGSIEVNYSVEDTLAEFWVKDTGIGIPQNQQAAVFDQFVQANFSHSSGYEGSGLGLSISKGYVKLLNGEIHLESEQNKGTTFHVRIPNNFTYIISSNENIQFPVSDQPILSKYKIIIAEDDETSFYFLKEVLKDIAESIRHAKDGLEAVELAKNHSDTDIILMDIKMPKLNGFEATKEIRSFNTNVFIIAQTAYAQESYKAKVSDAGCDAYISKPIDKQKLLDIISKCTNQSIS